MDREFIFSVLAIVFGGAVFFGAIGCLMYVEKSQTLKCIEVTTAQKYSAIEVNLICQGK